MRQKLRSVLCLFALLLVLLPATASANGLPRTSIYIGFAGLDDSITHVALLGSEPYPRSLSSPPEALTAALPDGWYVWDWISYDPKDQPMYFMNVPYPGPFRVAVLHEDNTLLVTDEAERTVRMQNFTVNTETGAISTLGPWFGLFKQFLCTFVFTLLIESVVLLIFRFKLGDNIGPFLLVNLATQILMTLTYGRMLLNDDWGQAIFWAFAIEAVIFVIESLAYARFLRGQTRARRVTYAITANLASFVIGTLLITPVYTALAF